MSETAVDSVVVGITERRSETVTIMLSTNTSILKHNDVQK